ncbi:LamG-like jellyroll fold domain-containing protein [Roseivirga sp.]|uniref:LamG-like jellyroll fold domain-containing protein n=1 Tax=Roseivirga sp. TaxID=1964215 RepID=UPI003B8CD9AD
MKNLFIKTIFGIVVLQIFSCQEDSSTGLKDALTFYTSFDTGTTADFALGDSNMYTASASYINSVRKLEEQQMGMHANDYRIASGKGKFGDAFEFGAKSSKVVYYKSKDNISYNPQNWSGTISFWLSVDPATDLDGYTDPVQITDKNYNDASIWVDFTNDNPPNFRLGVIGDKNAWTQDTLASPYQVEFEKRLVNVDSPPFSRKTWTHVLITYEDLSNASSIASLYLNGIKKGSISGIDDPFTWNLGASSIFLGLGFVGLMDELSIYNKPLTISQIEELYQLKDGVRSIL